MRETHTKKQRAQNQIVNGKQADDVNEWSGPTEGHVGSGDFAQLLSLKGTHSSQVWLEYGPTSVKTVCVFPVYVFVKFLIAQTIYTKPHIYGTNKIPSATKYCFLSPYSNSS